MSALILEQLVGKAVISDEFRAGLLNGRRAELIGSFGLEPDEVTAVMAIRASTLMEFAGAVEQLISGDEPAPLAAAYQQASGGLGAYGQSVGFSSPF
jgi:hypothetical protein